LFNFPFILCLICLILFHHFDLLDFWNLQGVALEFEVDYMSEFVDQDCWNIEISHQISIFSLFIIFWSFWYILWHTCENPATLLCLWSFMSVKLSVAPLYLVFALLASLSHSDHLPGGRNPPRNLSTTWTRCHKPLAGLQRLPRDCAAPRSTLLAARGREKDQKGLIWGPAYPVEAVEPQIDPQAPGAPKISQKRKTLKNMKNPKIKIFYVKGHLTQ